MQDRHADRRKGGIRGDAGRSERLAAELRANLVRRKTRARKMNAAEAELASEAGRGPAGPDRPGCDGIPVVATHPICDSNSGSERS